MKNTESEIERYTRMMKETKVAWDDAIEKAKQKHAKAVRGVPLPGMFDPSPGLVRWFWRLVVVAVALYVLYDLIPGFPFRLFIFLQGMCLGGLIVWIWRFFRSIRDE